MSNVMLYSMLLFGGIALIPPIAVGQDSLQPQVLEVDSITAVVQPDSDNIEKALVPFDSVKHDKSQVGLWGSVGGSLECKLYEANLSINKNLLSVHFFEYRKFEINLFSNEPPEPEYKELGLLYGRILTDSKRRFYFSVSAGISRMAITKWKVISVETRELLFSPYTYVEYDDYETVITGYPIKCKIMYRGKYFGVGLDLITNLNTDADYIAGALHISFGKLK